jgi:hypothetical protein
VFVDWEEIRMAEKNINEENAKVKEEKRCVLCVCISLLVRD